MNEKQRKMINKLNEDNKHLADANKTWVEYSKARLLIGVILVIVIIVGLIFTC